MENKTHLKTVSGYQLDEIDNQILELLIENTRMPYTEIAKKLIISAGTVHVRVRKMEEAGIITGSTLNIDYSKMGFSFTAYVGIYLSKTKLTQHVIDELRKIPTWWWRTKRPGSTISSARSRRAIRITPKRSSS